MIYIPCFSHPFWLLFNTKQNFTELRLRWSVNWYYTDAQVFLWSPHLLKSHLLCTVMCIYQQHLPSTIFDLFFCLVEVLHFSSTFSSLLGTHVSDRRMEFPQILMSKLIAPGFLQSYKKTKKMPHEEHAMAATWERSTWVNTEEI